jgi:hypothetical protein
MVKRFSIFLAGIFFLATLIGSFHSHKDGLEHHGCPICMTIYHQSNAVFTPPATCEIPAAISGYVYIKTDSAFINKIYFGPAQGRAPPA